MKEREKPAQTKIRVMIVDDHELMRDALAAIVSLDPDLLIAAAVESGQAAIDSLSRTYPDVVLMDGSMPGMNGMETTRRLRALQPGLKIIGLTLYDQTTYLEEMIEVGASGYVLKTSPPAEIVQAVRTVAGGGTYFDRSIPRRTSATVRGLMPIGELNSEELAVAKLLAGGRTKNEIAESLGVGIAEVETRRSAAMGKLGLHSRAQLVRIANERGWLKT
jgi:DNA-binding NarL/FixJ family response regulator